MPGEKPPPTAREETALLREEVALQKREAAERAEREARSEELKNRVSVAAIGGRIVTLPALPRTPPVTPSAVA